MDGGEVDVERPPQPGHRVVVAALVAVVVPDRESVGEVEEGFSSAVSIDSFTSGRIASSMSARSRTAWRRLSTVAPLARNRLTAASTFNVTRSCSVPSGTGASKSWSNSGSPASTNRTRSGSKPSSGTSAIQRSNKHKSRSHAVSAAFFRAVRPRGPILELGRTKWASSTSTFSPFPKRRVRSPMYFTSKAGIRSAHVVTPGRRFGGSERLPSNGIIGRWASAVGILFDPFSEADASKAQAALSDPHVWQTA